MLQLYFGTLIRGIGKFTIPNRLGSVLAASSSSEMLHKALSPGQSWTGNPLDNLLDSNRKSVVGAWIKCQFALQQIVGYAGRNGRVGSRRGSGFE
jgi:hypothetical protein